MNSELHHRILLLGWTLVNSVWQILAIGILFGFSLLIARRPSVRYATAALALFLCALAPIGTYGWLATGTADQVLLPVYTNAPHTVPFTHSGASKSMQIGEVSIPFTPIVKTETALSTRLERNMPILVSLWLLGFAVMCLRIGGGLLVIYRRRRAATTAEPEWQNRLDRLAKACDILKPVRILFSATLDSPIVIGVLRATILLPASILTSLTPDQVEALLAHELAHIKRHDFLVNLIQSAVEAVLFFHPVIWWISSTLRKERELCCDDFAVGMVGNPLCYARALASLESIRSLSPQLALRANGGQLMYRIQRIISSTKPSSAAGFAWLPCLIAMAVTGATAGTVAKVRPKLLTQPIAMVHRAMAAAKRAATAPVAPDPDPLETRFLEAKVPTEPIVIAPSKPVPTVVKKPVGNRKEVSGQVLSSDNVPVSHADVVLTLSPLNPHAVVVSSTDTKGFFKFSADIKPDQTAHSLYAYHQGQGIGRIGVDGTLHDLVVKLLPPTSLKVKVVDAEGHVLVGVKTRPSSLRAPYPAGGDMSDDFPVLIAEKTEAASDPQGIAILSGLPQGFSLRLDVDDDRFINVHPYEDISLPEKFSSDASLTLKAGATIEGRLLRDGKGVPGQQVDAYSGSDENSQGWTDANGAFRLPKLSAGKYILFAQLRPEVSGQYVADGLDIQLDSGEDKKNNDLILVPGVVVAGTITGPDKKPIKDVDVTFTGPDETHTRWAQWTKTGSTGKYQLRVIPGKQVASFWSKEHWLHGDRAVKTEYEVTGTAANQLDWSLPAVAKDVLIHGFVIGPDGKPVANATVLAQQPDMSNVTEITSGPNGSFTMTFSEKAAPLVQFRAYKDEFADREPSLASKGNLTIHLQPHMWSTVEGDVNDSKGTPIPDAIVALVDQDLVLPQKPSKTGVAISRAARPYFRMAVTADATGHFKFNNVLPGDHVIAYANRPTANHSSIGIPLEILPGSHVKIGPLIIRSANELSGTLVDPTGPLDGVQITIEECPSMSVKTDAKGDFRFAVDKRDESKDASMFRSLMELNLPVTLVIIRPGHPVIKVKARSDNLVKIHIQ